MFKAGGLFATTDRPGVLLDVLMRRYYKIRDLAPVTIERIGGFDVVSSSYHRHDRSVVVVSVRSSIAPSLDDALRALAAATSGVAPPDIAVVDLYLMVVADRSAATPTSSPVELATHLDAADLPRAIRRVAVIAVHPDPAVATLPFTFRRPDEDGPRSVLDAGEQRCRTANGSPKTASSVACTRLISRRLHMWRLSNFEISRLPSVDDVYAYDCVARENPADRRLVAVAEIRGLTRTAR